MIVSRHVIGCPDASLKKGCDSSGRHDFPSSSATSARCNSHGSRFCRTTLAEPGEYTVLGTRTCASGGISSPDTSRRRNNVEARPTETAALPSSWAANLRQPIYIENRLPLLQVP